MRRIPGAPRYTLAVDGGRRAARVRSLGGSSDWRRDLLDRVGAGLVRVGGTRLMPNAPAPWPWPSVSPDALGPTLGLDDLTVIGAAAPRQPGRQRLSVLAGRPGASEPIELVVKLGRPGDGLVDEARALRLLTDRPLPGIATPQVVADGTCSTDADGTIAFLVTTPLGLGRQRPAVGEALPNFERDLGERLASLPRPAGVADDAVPVHGDLAPWNLRRTDRGLALFDWEAAGWGSPGSDLAHYRAACDLLRARR